MQDLKHSIEAKPEQLLEYISISPVKEDNTLKGYRLNPGKKTEFFNQSGLKPNDLAISINGYDLRDMNDAAAFMATMNEQTQFAITVIRDDAEQNISIDLDGQ